ncbi:MAG TPA: RidA family protein [Candidatus Limnocylindrales bacterium]|nr:RidA family protein [Candidatus Limnocylindrales bacterium]
MSHHILEITSIHPTGGTYSHVVRAGDTLYVSGQVAKDRDNAFVGVGDPDAQCRQVFTNLAAVLEEAGSSLDHIVKLTIYLTDSAYIDTFRSVRNELLTRPMPASTLVVVSALAAPELLVEIEAIAVPAA